MLRKGGLWPKNKWLKGKPCRKIIKTFQPKEPNTNGRIGPPKESEGAS